MMFNKNKVCGDFWTSNGGGDVGALRLPSLNSGGPWQPSGSQALSRHFDSKTSGPMEVVVVVVVVF